MKYFFYLCLYARNHVVLRLTLHDLEITHSNILYIKIFFRWRIVDEEEEIQQLIDEAETCAAAGQINEEDISEDHMEVIHEKAQMDERKKFETYLKFPLTSRSRANRRINSRGNESSGANTPTPDATSPAPHQGDTEVS